MTEIEYVNCPECGIQTIPDHEELEYEDKLCDACYEKSNIKELK